LRLTESASDDGGYANDFVTVGACTDGFADGVHVVEEFSDQVRADEADRRVMRFIRFGQESARSHVHIAHQRIVRGDPIDVHVFQKFVSRAHVRGGAENGGDLAGGVHSSLQARELFLGDEGAFLGFDPLVVAGDDAETG